MTGSGVGSLKCKVGGAVEWFRRLERYCTRSHSRLGLGLGLTYRDIFTYVMAAEVERQQNSYYLSPDRRSVVL